MAVVWQLGLAIRSNRWAWQLGLAAFGESGRWLLGNGEPREPMQPRLRP